MVALNLLQRYLLRIGTIPNHTSACVHAFIDANNGNVYQCLPWNHRGWHSGGSSNNTHIGVEICEPNCIKYTKGSSFTCSDKEKAKEMVIRTYNSAVELFAKLCKDYKLNPLGKDVILSHSEGYKKGLASNHGDPEHLWKQLGLPYTMDTFRNDVKNKMTGGNTVNSDSIYKVQVGAYSSKINAESLLKKLHEAGFTDAFIVHGNTSIKSTRIEAGDKVKVINPTDYYGKKFTLHYDTYDVISITGDRVVIGVGKYITAAIKPENLEKIY